MQNITIIYERNVCQVRLKYTAMNICNTYCIYVRTVLTMT
jgi:hypothetical protein